jgi:hypothetical protein
MDDESFQRFGGLCAIGAAILALAYALLLVLSPSEAGSAGGLVDRALGGFEARGLNVLAYYALALTGLLMTAAMVAAYRRVLRAGPGWALWGLALGLLGAALMAIHGYWEALRKPILLHQWNTGVEARQAAISAFSGVPNPVDPRGLGAFLFIGVFVLVTSWLVLRGAAMGKTTGQWGVVYGVMLVALFVAGWAELGLLRMILAALTVGIAGPLWWVLLGRELLKPLVGTD